MPYSIVRHANDECKKVTFRHDNKLVETNLNDKVQKLMEKLIARYGLPDRIFCSPMRRTRRMLDIVMRHLKYTYKHKVPEGIWIDRRLSRFFIGEEQDHPEIAPCTKKYKIPIRETVSQFEARIRGFVRHMEKRGYHRRGGKVAWVFTHAVPYKEICDLNSIKTHEIIGFLDYEVVST